MLAFLAAMTFILYLDRSCINQAAPVIQKELGISETQKGIIFSAFALAYAIFEIPAGRWGDRYGSRRILTRIVLWWSFFTALTGAAWGFASLVVIRFLFGAGEAGALPNSARILREWFPDSSRGRAQGIVTTAMLLGGAASYTASQWLIDWVGWRWSFAVFALLGVAWAVAFYRVVPRRSGRASADQRGRAPLIAEGRMPVDRRKRRADVTRPASRPRRDVHGPIPWARWCPAPNIWLLSGAIITMSAMSELLNSWYPTYLQAGARGLAGPVGPSDHLGARPRCVRGILRWLADGLARAKDRKPAMGPNGSGSRRGGNRRLRHRRQCLDRLDRGGRGVHRAGGLRRAAPASVLVGVCHPGQRPASRGDFRTDEHDGRPRPDRSRSSLSAASPTGERAWATPAVPSGTRLFISTW